MKFRATLLLEGKSATGIQVPPEIVASLAAGKRPPVRVTIKGHVYRSSLAAFGEVFMLPVSAENREAAGVKAGDDLEVEIVLDAEPRVVDVPDDLAAALAAKPGARGAFDQASPSRRKEFVRQVIDAKTQETRDRRIAGIVAKLGDA